METVTNIIAGAVGGFVPAITVAIIYLMTTERRLTRIETHLRWICKEKHKCQQHWETDSG